MNSYKLHKLISKLNISKVTEIIPYDKLVSIGSYDPVPNVKYQVADAVAHAIAGEILKGGTWERRLEPEGEVYSVKGIWLDYNSLYKLVEEAYSMGRLEPVARINNENQRFD